ncbi:MAG: sporulation integral membrane protein YtvI [Oscillospiraceae bacterium]|nr:sporulation integral membrane protein YtvI [Oscillospiraceae bacterium]
METKRETDPKVTFLINLAYWAAILAIIYFIFRYFLRILTPIAIALVLAAVVRPLARWLSRETRYVKNEAGERVLVRRKFRMNATLAGILSVLLLYLILAGLITLLIARVADSAVHLAAGAPDFYENSVVPGITRLYERILALSARVDDSVVAAVQASIPNLISSIGSAVTTFSARLVSWLTSFATRLPTILLNTLITMIATVFFAVDFDRMKLFIRRNLKEKTLRMVVNVKNSFLDMIWRFIRSYFLIFLITSAENTVGLWIIGVKHPLFIGILVGIFDAFPIVGSGTILIPWAVITLITGNVARGIALLALYLIITVVRQIIEPRIVGQRVGLRPIVTLTCMYVGTRLFGGVGLFAVPIMAAIVADLNSTGIIHLFRRVDEPEAEEEKIRTEGVDA